MSPTHNNHDESAPSKGPTKELAAFFESERAHRRNSDSNFDPKLFDEAAALVLDRLAAFNKDPRG